MPLLRWMDELISILFDIFVQKNKIEMLNMTGAKLLVYLDASHNQLTNIHGLHGCSSLRHLDLSHNRITRVGKSCWRWLPSVYITSVCVHVFITGPPNEPVLFCTLTSVVYCHRRHAGGWMRGRSGSRHCTAGQYGYVPLERHLVMYFLWLLNCVSFYFVDVLITA